MHIQNIYIYAHMYIYTKKPGILAKTYVCANVSLNHCSILLQNNVLYLAVLRPKFYCVVAIIFNLKHLLVTEVLVS